MTQNAYLLCLVVVGDVRVYRGNSDGGPIHLTLHTLVGNKVSVRDMVESVPIVTFVYEVPMT